MNLFEAYLLVVLIPGICGFSLLAAFLCAAGVLVCILMYGSCDRDQEKKVLSVGKKLMAGLVLFMLVASVTPDTKQLALMFGLKLGASEQAIELYGEAGDYLLQYMKDNLPLDDEGQVNER